MKTDFTELEKMILDATAKRFRWIARGQHGGLSLYTKKPQREEGGHWAFGVRSLSQLRKSSTSFEAFNHLFKSIKADDLEPRRFR